MTALDTRLKEYTARCRECGECLVRCRYLSLPRDEAVAAMRALNAGEHSAAHERCVSCYACNAFCPHDAHPYERIISRWNARYEKQGLPVRAKSMMPTLRPNFRRDVRYTAQERALHESWASPEPPADTVLYPGCNLLTMPGLATGALFDRLPVWGGWDQCCGEMYFRMGLFGPAQTIAGRLTAFYKSSKLKEMVFLCPACWNMFTNVLPGHFGAKFGFRTTHFVDYFTRALDRGEFTLKKKLSGSVVVHDSCHARVIGGDFMERQRALLARLGLTVRETPLHGADGLCCGMAAGATRFSGADMLKQSLRQLRALDKAPGSDIALYCTGCLLTMNIARLMKPYGKKIFHTIELVRSALGEDPIRHHVRRAAAVTGIIARNALPVYLSPRRFFIHEREIR
ncbi:MAG: (Fe-S)-binding protein [Spirochaetes bacterium]|nr:MAG: (Fe-S)-binding protein [Spirochaetota bacterium]